jgi:hypothetical protein
MSSKRSAGSILEYFTKTVKGQKSSLSTDVAIEEIGLIDFIDLPTSSRDKNSEIPSVAQVSSDVNSVDKEQNEIAQYFSGNNTIK